MKSSEQENKKDVCTLNINRDVRMATFAHFFTPMPLFDSIRILASEGWTVLDSIMGDVLFGEPDKNRIKTIKDLCGDLGVECPLAHLPMHGDIAHISDDQRLLYIDYLKRWLDAFAELEIPLAVIHPGGEYRAGKEVSEEAVKEKQIDSLERLCCHIKGSEIRICLENVRFTKDVFDLTEMLHDRPLGICLDTGHLHVWDEKTSLIEFVRRAGKRLLTLHIQDTHSVEIDEHLLPYEGVIDWNGFGEALHDVGYKGVFNYEVPGEIAWGGLHAGGKPMPMEARILKLRYMRELGEWMLGRKRLARKL